jgi:hypothetical protein
MSGHCSICRHPLRDSITVSLFRDGAGPRLGNGFALVAAPAEYGVTGVKTFIVSHDGVVYEKDFGPKTLDELLKMERFNPDKSWSPVSDRDD